MSSANSVMDTSYERLIELVSQPQSSNAPKKDIYMIISTSFDTKEQSLELLEDIPSVSLYLSAMITNSWTEDMDQLDYAIALKSVQIRDLYLAGGTMKVYLPKISLSCSHIVQAA